jgi:large subunit ribosomal protein L28
MKGLSMGFKGLKCDNCGKGVMYGHNVSHSKRRTRRIFKPNLHSARITLGSSKKKLRLCTKCLRELKGRFVENREVIQAQASL